jgi:hypothetical protein
MVRTLPTFQDARLKIDRANKHIRDIERRIRRLEESYSATIQINPKFGYQEIKYDLSDKTAIEDISLFIGDALHNMKCALDYGWLIVLERHAPAAINRKTQFPAYESFDALEQAMKRTKIDILSPALFNFMLTKIKPYSGANDVIWDVKQLNILDKHRLLLPLIHYTGIAGLEMEDESGELRKGSGTATMQPPPWYIRVADGWHVKKKGKPAIDVLFADGIPSHHLNASSFLDLYSMMILQTLEILEGF